MEKVDLKYSKNTSKGLEWIADADEFGDFIIGKHKGDTGKFVRLLGNGEEDFIYARGSTLVVFPVIGHSFGEK